jgi:predicted nucleic acid-binding protein
VPENPQVRVPNPPISVLDTATLFPASLRDTLLLSVEHDLFVPNWSIETLAELARNLVDTGTMAQAQADRLLAVLTNSFPFATVQSTPELQAFVANHPKDRHVLAAAIASKSEFIVTPNLRDFGEEALSPFGVRACSPDDFLLMLLERDAATVLMVIELQWKSLRRPPMTRDQVLDSLAKIAPKFAETVRNPQQ